MEKIVKQSLLYDFYGELLTEHQKSIYEDYVLNNIGISEIAEERGISRQSVFDMIKRCDKLLEGYEDKLHLLQRFTEVKLNVNALKETLINLEIDSRLEENHKRILKESIKGLEEIVEKL